MSSRAKPRDLSGADKDPSTTLRFAQDVLSICSLSLHHFRNYDHARIEVAPQPVVLFGHNGAGKTNLLEAVSLLVPGRGLRRARLGDMHTKPSPPEGEGWVRGGAASTILQHAPNGATPLPAPPPQGGREKEWAVVAYAHGLQGEVTLATGSDPEAEQEKRLIKIDGKPAKSQADLARHLSIAWLTPQMEQVFLESASEGRKFLDRLTYHFDAEHASHVNAYDNAMRERNRLLAVGGDPAWLGAVENTMAEKAAAIASSRLFAVQHLNHAIADSPLSFPKPMLAVRGMVEDALESGASALEAEGRFRDALAAGRREDAGAGRTLTGTHRSQFAVTHRQRGMQAHLCSTGEQKALLLSILLAQSRASARWRQVVPILLLDEVVAHLDPAKRIELFEEICDTGSQVWMTGTDAGLFDGIRSGAQFFEVRGGVIYGNQ